MVSEMLSKLNKQNKHQLIKYSEWFLLKQWLVDLAKMFASLNKNVFSLKTGLELESLNECEKI